MSAETELARAMDRVAALRAGEPPPVFADHLYLIALADKIERQQAVIDELRRVLETVAKIGGAALQREYQSSLDVAAEPE